MVFEVVMILSAASVKANGAIAVEDAAGLAVFYCKVAVVLLVAGKVVVAVESLSQRMKVFC